MHRLENPLSNRERKYLLLKAKENISFYTEMWGETADFLLLIRGKRTLSVSK